MNGRYVVDENGKRLGILLDIKEYERMIEEMEDAHTAARTSAAIERGEEELIPFDQAMQEIEVGKVYR